MQVMAAGWLLLSVFVNEWGGNFQRLILAPNLQQRFNSTIEVKKLEE